MCNIHVRCTREDKSLRIQLENTRNYQQSQPNYDDARLFMLSPQMAEKFPLLPRRAQDSQVINCCCGCWVSASDEKPLSAELRRYHGLGVDVALLQLGFDVADLDPLPLITNNLME